MTCRGHICSVGPLGIMNLSLKLSKNLLYQISHLVHLAVIVKTHTNSVIKEKCELR